jgi:DNA repair exonuclease SbcCD nuclease subunit
MKKEITIISTDWHIKKDNVSIIKDLISQKIELAKLLKIDKVFCLGDVFQSRQEQPLSVLKCFEDCLDLFKKAEIKLICIPGNHDKTNYDSRDSFLDSFSWHPALSLTREAAIVKIGEITFRMIPFFNDEVFTDIHKKSIDKIPIKKNEVLLSHMAVVGSINNDGSKVEKSIDPKSFKGYELTLLGHYHNYHKVSGEVYHIPSLYQKDYSEDNNKGFTIVYDDLSFEIKNSIFKEYKTIDIDLDTVSAKEFKETISKIDVDESFYRLKLKGSVEKVNSVKSDELKIMGFSVKKEAKDIEVSIEEVEAGNFVEFTDSAIIEEFQIFCEKEKYEDIEKGNNYLKKKLNG